MAVYARALTSAEVTDHYMAGLAPKGLLARIHEPAGNQMVLRYTGPLLTSITDTVGRELRLAYTSTGQLQTIQDASGRVVRYGFDSSGRLAYVWDPLASPTFYPSRVLANNPAAYWRLGEASGTSAADAGPNGVTGTYNGGITLGAAGAIAADSDTAVTVDGSTGYMSASGSGALNITGSAITVEGWVRGASQAAYSYLVSKSDNNGTLGYALYTGASAKLSFFLNTSGSGVVMASSPTSPWDNNWHYVAGTYDGAYARLYIDGTLVASQAGSGTVTASSSVALNLGRYNGGGLFFNGSLDEFAVLPSALSATDIAARINSTPSWQYTYDGAGRHIATITDPDGRVAVTNTYDAQGRLATQKDGLLKTTSFAYTDTTATITDPRTNATVSTFDARKRPISVQNTVGANTYTLSFSYDDCGNRASVTDRRGNRTDYIYDTACKGNLLELNEPQVNAQTPRYTTTWVYDSKNNPTQVTDVRGFVTTNTYHATSNVPLSTSRQITTGPATYAVTKWEYGDTANPGLPTKIIAPRGNTGGTPNYAYATTYSLSP